jgi:hypothetical protein
MAAVGQIWERKQPEDDEYDRLRVVGVHGSELQLQPAAEFGDVVGADPALLAASYVLVEPADVPVVAELGKDALAVWIA